MIKELEKVIKRTIDKEKKNTPFIKVIERKNKDFNYKILKNLSY